MRRRLLRRTRNRLAVGLDPRLDSPIAPLRWPLAGSAARHCRGIALDGGLSTLNARVGRRLHGIFDRPLATHSILGACPSIPRGRDRDGFAFSRGGADVVGLDPNEEATTM